MHSIKGRLLSAFLALGLLVIPFLIFSFISLKKSNHLRDTREKVISFNASRLKAQSSFGRMMDFDVLLVDFYKSEESTANQLDYHLSLKKSTKALYVLSKAEIKDNPIFNRRIEKLQKELEYFDHLSTKITDLRKERGFRNYGLEGEMRSQIHQLEQIQGISLADILMLRRFEKDFFLRKDIFYVHQLTDSLVQIKTRLKERIATAKKEEQTGLETTLAILGSYQSIFGRMVELELEIGNEEAGLTQEWLKSADRMDLSIERLSEMVSTESQLLSGRIRTNLILLFISTLALAVFLSLAIANRISTPIEKLISDMDYISKNQFNGTIKLHSKMKIKELHELTDTYNKLVKKIRRQLQVLGTQNVSLTRLNQKLTQSELELQEASQIKNKFFSIISHDLRGHTGNIVSIAKILDQERGEISAKEQQTFVQYLRESSQNLQMLLDNLLNWAKTQMNDHTLSPRAFDIEQLLYSNAKLFSDHASRKGIQLECEEVKVSRVYADKDMVDFVIRNLLSNALKFSRNGDRIGLTAYETDSEVWIEVSDTGVGMTQEQMDELLTNQEENHSTKGTENEIGTGLGFAICRDFIARNGGQITIESTMSKGSRFSFSVPTRITRNTLFRQNRGSKK